MQQPHQKVYSIPTLKRLPSYLRELKRLKAEGKVQAASPLLAQILQIDTMTVRKDLETMGVTGQPGVGFLINDLINSIECFLGWKNTNDVFLVGTKGFGHALLNYHGFTDYGMRIVAAFEDEPVPEDMMIGDVPVFGLSRFKRYTERLHIRIGILCVEDDMAQKTAEMMVESGILAIWNFTAQMLRLPAGIINQRVNIGGDLAVLSVKLAERMQYMNNAELINDRENK